MQLEFLLKLAEVEEAHVVQDLMEQNVGKL
jgi:hypothetical protein